MAENFFALSAADRKEALAVAASKSGRPAHILEKDAWVVWTLSVLVRSPFAQNLIFKGGTSLSKIYRAIERFSEDIDVTPTSSVNRSTSSCTLRAEYHAASRESRAFSMATTRSRN